MSSTLDYLLEGFWTQTGDPRTTHLPLMSSLRPLLTLLSLYSLFVLCLGPRLMAHHPAFSLAPLRVVYNLIMLLWNGYFLYQTLALTNFGFDSFNVDFPIFSDTSELEMVKIRLVHQYLISKLVELLDTVFFVLRKKRGHVTWLHVYHHASTPLFGWAYFRLCGRNPVITMFTLLNTVIHMIIYAYCGLAACGPRMWPYLWWKRYIMACQILQFALLFAYGLYFSLYQSGFPRFFLYHALFQPIMYLLLYCQMYRRRRETNKAA